MAPSFRGLGSWLALVDRDGQHCVGLVLLSAVVVGSGAVQLLTGPLALTSEFSLKVLTMLLLMLQFLGAGLLAGVLASPRADLAGELAEILGGVRPVDLLLVLLRCSLFLMAAAGWTLRETVLGLRRGEPPARLVGEGLLHGLVLVLVLKLCWSLAIDPLSFGAPA